MRRKLLGALGLVALGVVVAFPLFGATYKVMTDTSTPEFCASCHEIVPAVEGWRASTHANNKKGLVAKCIDCHLPPPEDTARFFTMKTYHGLKDVVGHLLHGSSGYDKAEAREDLYAEIDNSTCLRCHENVTQLPYNRGAMLAHRSVINPVPGMEKKCVDCHYDLVHTEKRMFMYSQVRDLPYRAKGLRTLARAGRGE